MKNYICCLVFGITILMSGCSKKITEPVQQLNNSIPMLKEDVSILADDKMEGREAGTKGEKMAAEYIANRMGDIGLSPGYKKSYYQDFERRIKSNPHATEPSPDDTVLEIRNVVGELDNNSEGYIVIGAHYDHLGYGNEGSLHSGEKAIHNGADDNASGIAILLDVANRLVSNGKEEDHNFLFIGFSGEEKGLWGSNYYAKNAGIDMAKISFMFNMDMVGRLNDERSLAVHGTGTSPVFANVLKKENDQNFKLVFSESGVGPSDHTSFYLEDVPVLHFFTGQHPDYHRPSDDADLLNYTGMEDISEFLYDLIMELDKEDDLEFRKTKDESQETPKFSVTLGVIPDYLFDGKGMRIDGVKEERPAAVAGIVKGDIVIQMGDLEIVDMMSYMKGLSVFKPGDEVNVVILRNGEEIVKKVKF